MTVLQLALRCAALYTKSPDVTKIGAVNMTLFADAISGGLADYWASAPEYITNPDEAQTLATVANTADVPLPAHFEQLSRPPRIRRSASESWRELIPVVEPLNPVAYGMPQWFRVRDSLVDSPAWSTGGNLPDNPAIILYPTPDAVYTLNVQASYEAPRIALEHLSGAPLTVNLPIPDNHITTMVVPLCAPYFLRYPDKLDSLTAKDAAEDAARGQRLLDATRSRRISGPAHVGTPRRW